LGDLLAAALAYAAKGWPVLPVKPRSKQPLTRHGVKDATTDAATIETWWRRWPAANVGIATGASSFDMLDIDGPAGEESIAQLEAAHGELPAGPQQLTGRGRQRAFRGGSLPSRVKAIPGVDTRTTGLYVVAAPSIHPNGATYTWEDEDEPFPEPPAWLVEALQREKPAMDEGDPASVYDENARLILGMAGIPLVKIEQGQRNDRLFRFGASLRARGSEPDAILRILRVANEHLCEPALDERELRQIATSASRLDVSEHYRRGYRKTEEMADRAAEEVGPLNAQDVLGHASERMGITITGIKQLGRGKPVYGLVVAGGTEVLIGPPGVLLSQSQLTAVLLGATGKVMKPSKAAAWRSIVEALVSQAEIIDLEDFEPTAEVMRWIDGYLDGRPPTEDVLDGLKRLAPIQREGETFIHAPSLARWLATRPGEERVSPRALAVQLRSCGLEPVFLGARDAADRVVGRRYWKVPARG